MISILSYMMPDLFLVLSLALVILIGVSASSMKSYWHIPWDAFFHLLVLISAFVFYMLLTIVFYDSYITFFQVCYQYQVLLSRMILVGIFAIFILMSLTYWAHLRVKPFEFIILCDLVLISSSLLVAANDGLLLYLTIEFQALTLYCFAAMRTNLFSSTRAGLKYFIISSFASAIILMGLVVIYENSAISCFDDIINLKGMLFIDNIGTLAEPSCFGYDYFINVLNNNYTQFGLIVGLIMLVSGFFFKLNIAPFHLWILDIYEDAPLVSVTLFATFSKLSMALFFLRLYQNILLEFNFIWHIVFIFFCISSSFIGVLGAIFENHMIRLLANSGIFNLSFILIGILPNSMDAFVWSSFYLITYICQTCLIFYCLLIIRKFNNFNHLDRISDFISSFANLSFAYTMVGIVYALASISPFLNMLMKLNMLWILNDSVVALFAPILNVACSIFMSLAYLRIIRDILFYKLVSLNHFVTQPNTFTSFYLILLNFYLILVISIIDWSMLY